MPRFLRRYQADKAHRMLTEDRAYCGKHMPTGWELRGVAKIARCAKCEEQYERTPDGVLEVVNGG